MWNGCGREEGEGKGEEAYVWIGVWVGMVEGRVVEWWWELCGEVRGEMGRLGEGD